MRPGDIVLVGGSDWQSRLIQLGTGGPWNHAAICVGDGGEIAEALASGVAPGNVDKYAGARTATIDTGLSDDERSVAARFATTAIGDRYDWLNIAAFAINLATDGKVVLGRDGSYICSALCYRALQFAAPRRFDADPHTISPNDLARIWGVR